MTAVALPFSATGEGGRAALTNSAAARAACTALEVSLGTAVFELQRLLLLLLLLLRGAPLPLVASDRLICPTDLRMALLLLLLLPAAWRRIVVAVAVCVTFLLRPSAPRVQHTCRDPQTPPLP